MKYIIIGIVLASLGLIVYGFSIRGHQVVVAHKCIGFGTVGLFLVAMPLFLINASKGKNLKDYMLTEENIRKMQGKKGKKEGDQ